MGISIHTMGVEKYKDDFKVRCHENSLSFPYTWEHGKIVFVNPMIDPFHKNVRIEFIKKELKVMYDNHQHVFHVLTKRAVRLFAVHNKLKWTANILMRVSVEHEKVIDRIDFLRKTNSKVKFLSCESLIGPLPKLNLRKIDWVIVGSQSGHKPRPMNPDWVLNIQQQCEQKDVAFFFKQWGGKQKNNQEEF